MARRRLLQRLAGALGLAVSLAGCGGTQAASDAGSSQLVVARVKDAVSLDPAHETDGNSLNMAAAIYETLVAFVPGSFTIKPAIARHWTTSADGKTWTFDLVPGRVFSDGKPLDAAAVKFNFDRWRLKRNQGNFPYGYYASQFGGFDDKSVIANVSAPTRTRVVFTLRTPFGPFLHDLAMTSFSIGEPAAILRDPLAFATAPVASGPYVAAEWLKNDHLTLRANPHWTGPKTAYDTVIVRDIPDQSTSVLSLENGDVDMLVDPRPDDAKLLAKQPSLKLYPEPSNNVMYLALNVERKPFDDVRVRRAISYALDKTAIARDFYTLGAIVADNWTPRGMLGENRSVKALPHDPARARALLAEAGLAGGFHTDLYYPTAPRPYMPEPQRIAEAMQANLREVGIDVTLQPFEFGVFLSKVRNGEHPMCLIGWTGDNGDPDNFMYTLLDQDSAVKGEAQNYSFWRDPAFHKLMLAGQRETVDAKRAVIYERANAMIADQVPAVPIVHSVVSFAAKRSIAGVVPRPDSRLDFESLRPAAGTPAP